jgi:hypothetical protein
MTSERTGRVSPTFFDVATPKDVARSNWLAGTMGAAIWQMNGSI